MDLKYIVLALIAIMTFSCRTPVENIYFADATNLAASEIGAQEYIKIKPGDKLSVLISTGNEKFDEIFNATYLTKDLGFTPALRPNYQNISRYTVDSDGDLSLPVIGDVKAAGLTRAELAQEIERVIIDGGYANNVVVLVEFESLTVTVLGEVGKPGRYNLERDGVSVVDALGVAGDLTIYGNRNDIKVVRDENGKKRTYVIDLNSVESTVGSPGFYLQQNDVVYVAPNESRIRQSIAGGNDIYTTTFWISLSSLLTSIASLVINW